MVIVTHLSITNRIVYPKIGHSMWKCVTWHVKVNFHGFLYEVLCTIDVRMNLNFDRESTK